MDLKTVVETLGISPVIALILLNAVALGFFIWKTAEIKSQVSYLIKCTRENQVEHKELRDNFIEVNKEIASIREAIAEMRGRTGRGKSDEH